VPADPDELPRTQKFGVDVEKFQQMTGDCPNKFLQTALYCCQVIIIGQMLFVRSALKFCETMCKFAIIFCLLARFRFIFISQFRE